METGAIMPEAIDSGIKQIAAVCAAAWQEGLMKGWSGNASMRLPDAPGMILITSSGSAKGRLAASDCLLINISDGSTHGKKRPSSESELHLGIYRALPKCQAILHTHPPKLQALSMVMAAHANSDDWHKDFLKMELYEAEVWSKRLAFVSAIRPGTPELADAAVNAIKKTAQIPHDLAPSAAWLQGHGLCAIGATLIDALCLTEELEHLASVRLQCACYFNSFNIASCR